MRKQINLFFLIFAFIFLVSLQFKPYPLSYLIKAVPAFLSAIACFTLLKNKSDAILMGLGFLFCMSGDIFLDINREAFFVQGLGSFLAGHVFFSIVFIRKFYFSSVNAVKAGFVFLYLIVISLMLIPHLGELFVPVAAYICVIGIMGLSAAFLKTDSPYIFIGAALFVFSDSIIAVTKFLWPFNASLYFIIFFYFSSLFFLQYGAVKEFGK